MKKTILIFLVLLSMSFIFAADNSRFYCITATTNVGSGRGEYRFEYSTVFNLTDYFNGTPRYSDYNGKLNASNAIGTIGVANCNDEILYTIEATNQSRFVSQSDPSKYRDYYLVVVPDRGDENVRAYYYPNGEGYTSASALSSLEHNGTITMIAPVSNGSSYVNVNDYGRMYIKSVGLDLFLCMKQLTDDDLVHLAPGDDYYATIRVQWQCGNTSCTENHSGSFDITVRGYYQSTTSSYDSFFLLLEPTPQSTNLNIKEVTKAAQAVTIANFKINTTTKETTTQNPYSWSDHLFAFLSASPDYSVSDDNGFILQKVGDVSTTVPYTLTVTNTTNGVITENTKVYDGKDYFTDKSSATTFCIDLTDYTKTSIDTYQDTYKAINYEGRVDLKINQFSIPGSGNSFAEVMNNPTSSSSFLDDYRSYIGKYESNIYYHIVYSD